MAGSRTPSLPLVLLVATAGCGIESDGRHAADDPLDEAVRTDRIEMHDNEFVPAVIEVPAGTRVTWGFTDDGRRHDVVGDSFESDVSATGTFTHTFVDAGTHPYHCSRHRGMTGLVVVE